MSIVYEPSGKAREYSPLALNVYLSCTHRCEYCYAPRCRHQTRDQYFAKPFPRIDIAAKLDNELSKWKSKKNQVLMSFIGDVYCETEDDNEATRNCLEILLKHNFPVAILTKGGERCLRDLDLFKKFGEHIQIGTTLTFDNQKNSLEWERGAATPDERLETLKILHNAGIKTFASFETVIVPAQSLNLMKHGLPFIDTYKVGKLNNYRGIDKNIDWKCFLEKTVELLRDEKKDFYIKEDLRKCAASVPLYGNEAVADEHNVK